MQAKKEKIFYLTKQKLTVSKGNILIEVIRKLMETTHDKGIVWSKRIKYTNVLVILEPFPTGRINRQGLKAAFPHQKNFAIKNSSPVPKEKHLFQNKTPIYINRRKGAITEILCSPQHLEIF